MSEYVKAALRPYYRRSSTLKALVKTLRRSGYFRAAKANASPFMGDACLRQVVDYILTECAITQFVETGTYLGHTCRYIAAGYPNLPILTVEIEPDFFAASQSSLRQFKNVTQVLGNSAETLQRALQDGSIQGCPLFFLDAHWYDYLPLPDEIRMIGEGLEQAVILIHDFQVPGRPEFGFDVCTGRAIALELLQAAQAPNRTYDVFFPRYSVEDAYGPSSRSDQQLRGYALVFQQAPAAVDRFLRSEHAGRFAQYSA